MCPNSHDKSHKRVNGVPTDMNEIARTGDSWKAIGDPSQRFWALHENLRGTPCISSHQTLAGNGALTSVNAHWGLNVFTGGHGFPYTRQEEETWKPQDCTGWLLGIHLYILYCPYWSSFFFFFRKINLSLSTYYKTRGRKSRFLLHLKTLTQLHKKRDRPPRPPIRGVTGRYQWSWITLLLRLTRVSPPHLTHSWVQKVISFFLKGRSKSRRFFDLNTFYALTPSHRAYSRMTARWGFHHRTSFATCSLCAVICGVVRLLETLRLWSQ